MSWIPLLLTDPSPTLRYLVHKHLLQDTEAKELVNIRLQDPLLERLLKLQKSDGSWTQTDTTGHSQGKIQATAQALTRLGYLEIPSDHPAVRKAVEYLYNKQKSDGSWPLKNYRTESEGKDSYDSISLQTSIPLRGLAEAGYATDPRSELAYDWLNEQQMEDGAWPTGIADNVYGYVAGYRRIPHSRWGCRSNTTSAVTCMSLHDKRSKSKEARRGLDLLLGRETKERYYIGYDTARTVGFEPSTGFLTYYARFDNAQILKLCTKIEASTQDPRVQKLLDFITGQQGPYELWDYTPKPQATKWVTYDIIRSLRELLPHSDWISNEPHTPFQPYPKRRKRF